MIILMKMSNNIEMILLLKLLILISERITLKRMIAIVHSFGKAWLYFRRHGIMLLFTKEEFGNKEVFQRPHDFHKNGFLCFHAVSLRPNEYNKLNG